VYLLNTMPLESELKAPEIWGHSGPESASPSDAGSGMQASRTYTKVLVSESESNYGPRVGGIVIGF